MPDAKIRKDLVKADPKDLPGHETDTIQNDTDVKAGKKRKGSKHGQ